MNREIFKFCLLFYRLFFGCVKLCIPIIVLHFVILISLGIALSFLETRRKTEISTSLILSPKTTIAEKDRRFYKVLGSFAHWQFPTTSISTHDITRRLDKIILYLERKEQPLHMGKNNLERMVNGCYITFLASILGLGKYVPHTLWGKFIILFSSIIGIITMGIVVGIAVKSVSVAYDATVGKHKTYNEKQRCPKI